MQIGTRIELKIKFDPIPAQKIDPNPINRVPDPRNRNKYIKQFRSTTKVAIMLYIYIYIYI